MLGVIALKLVLSERVDATRAEGTANTIGLLPILEVILVTLRGA